MSDDIEVEDLSENVSAVSDRLNELEDRVYFLEGQADETLDERRFKERVNRLFRSDAVDIDVTIDDFGHQHAHAVGLNTDQLNIAIERVEEQYDYGWEVTETGEGLGIEVWTETFK